VLDDAEIPGLETERFMGLESWRTRYEAILWILMDDADHRQPLRSEEGHGGVGVIYGLFQGGRGYGVFRKEGFLDVDD